MFWLILGLLEVALRLTSNFGLNHPYKIKQRNINQELYQGQPWVRNEFSVEIKRNSEGYRGPSFERLGDRERRIVIIGDSFTEAKQVSEEYTFWNRTQESIEGLQLIPFYVGAVDIISRLERADKPLRKFFIDKNASYAPVDLVVLTYTRYSIPSSEKSEFSWQFLSKQAIIEGLGLQAGAYRLSKVRWSSVSFLAYRIYRWMRFGNTNSILMTENQAFKFQRKYLAMAANKIHKYESLWDVPIVVLYMGDYFDAVYRKFGSANFFRLIDFSFDSFRSAGIDFIDGTTYLEPTDFFEVDMHPNHRGHLNYAKPLTKYLETYRWQSKARD